jgi:hypothetical protein
VSLFSEAAFPPGFGRVAAKERRRLPRVAPRRETGTFFSELCRIARAPLLPAGADVGGSIKSTAAAAAIDKNQRYDKKESKRKKIDLLEAFSHVSSWRCRSFWMKTTTQAG